MHPCPSLEQLQRLLEETLETASFDAVAHHLEECATCRDVLDALTDSTAGVWPPAGAPHPESGVTQAHSRGLYRPIRLHARGGLGEVFEVRDEQFQRPVALKVLHERDGADPERRRRFLEEARITAQLEHPGIPPVHALAQTDDGRPGYTMRFLQGETLHEAVRKFHEADQPGQDPRTHRLALRQLLGRFLAVCNTVAYAHSRGLVHGDLKPANIMLAPFGETLVLDWGLARRFAGTEENPASDATKAVTAGLDSVGRIANPSPQPDGLPIRPTDQEPIEAAPGPGVVVSQVSGTPGFMSPEQAAGRGARVGPASDIYSLGASLYYLLTGRPPFPAPRDRRDWQEIAARIRRGDFRRPRVVNPRIPVALEAVCLKAMALRPQDRYAGVLALAADLERWLAGEPVSARRESWWERGGRWVRKHQVLSAAAAVGVLIALASLAVAMVMLRAAYGREQQARAAAETQRAKADTYLESALQAVRSYLRQIHEGTHARVPLEEGGSLPSLSGDEEILTQRLQELTEIQDHLLAKPDDQDPRFVQLHSFVLHGLGICHSLLGHRAEGEKFYLQALDLHERLLAESGASNTYAFDLADTACDLARRYRSWEQPDKARRLFERVERVFDSLKARPAVAATLGEQMAVHLRLFGPPEEGLAWQEKMITLLEAVHQREPAYPYVGAALREALKAHALCCKELHRHAEMLQDWDRLRALSGALSPDTLLIHALYCMELHRYAEALQDWDRLGALNSTLLAEFRVYRAICLAKEGDHVQATAVVTALAATSTISSDDLYHLATTFAVSVSALRQDAALPRAEADHLAERYAAEALALLKRARAAGYFHTPAARKDFTKDADFDPLRSRADFRQFVATLSDKEPAGQR